MRRAGLLVALLTVGCSREPSTFPGAPVLLISIDTLRADHVPAYGYRRVETPAIDGLRRDGVLFRRTYSPCPMTLPSHATMITGLLPPEHGVRSNAGFGVRADLHPGLPALLRGRGYRLGAAVSSWILRAETGLAGYFDEYDDAIDAPPGSAFAEHQRSGAVTAASARAWIEARGDGPWFYFLHLYEPHVPYDPPEPFRSRYASAPYDGEIAAADAVVGGLLDWLRRRGLYDRAIIVLTSDHGEGLGDHGEQQHSVLLYREVLEVPLIVKLPGGARAGTTIESPAQLADIAPTLAELVGVGPLRPTSGASLFGPHGPRALYAETLYPRLQLGWSDLRSVIEDRYHYIEGPRPELYDLATDPGETRDLAAAEPEVARQLHARLAAVPRGESRPQTVDGGTAERLAALGYVGTPRDRVGPLPNPRDELPCIERLGEALRLAAGRRDAEALAALRRLLDEQPGLVEAWIASGDVLLRMARYDEAVAAYGEALARAPLGADVVLSRGTAHLLAGRLAEAEADAKRAAPELPARSAELRARVAMAAGRWDEAEALARGAAEVRRPAAPSTLVFLAEVEVRRGAFAQALATLDRAERAARDSHLAKVHRLEFVRADALARLARPAEAEGAYRREVAAFPEDLQAYANLAILLYVQGRGAQARAALEEMVRTNPNPASHDLAARTRAALGRR